MKNYVKEYRGYKVPEGATHFTGQADKNHAAFWNNDIAWVLIDDIIEDYPAHAIPKSAIELPEAEQEWNGEGLPPIGTECVMDEHGHEYLFSANTQGLTKITGDTVLIVIGHCIRHDNGTDLVTLMAKDSSNIKGFTTINPDYLKPSKTQQEKDREAFHLKAFEVHKFGMDCNEFADALFNAGFAAPRATDDE